MQKLPEELFSLYYRDVYSYLYGMSSDASLSEDLASEVFLEAVRSVSSFRGESGIRTWLFSIARHRWSAYLRKKKRTPQTAVFSAEEAVPEPNGFNLAEYMQKVFRMYGGDETVEVEDVVRCTFRRQFPVQENRSPPTFLRRARPVIVTATTAIHREIVLPHDHRPRECGGGHIVEGEIGVVGEGDRVRGVAIPGSGG